MKVISACYALIAKEVKHEKSMEMSGEVRRLLQEFKDITLEEIPIGLPLDRGISYQIDLIMGSSMPNQVTYQLSMIENE